MTSMPVPSLGIGTVLDERPSVLPDNGDHEKFSHYVDKNALMRATVDGVAVRAICGKKWLPTRDGSQFPVCPTCKAVYDGLPDGPGNDLPDN